MPFITTPAQHRFPWYVRLFFWNQRRKYGAVLEPARLWGRSPGPRRRSYVYFSTTSAM